MPDILRDEEREEIRERRENERDRTFLSFLFAGLTRVVDWINLTTTINASDKNRDISRLGADFLWASLSFQAPQIYSCFKF